MKRILNLLFIGFAFMLFSSNVSANNISKISMDIYIDKNGDAYITETWNAYLNEGTEGYRYYGNLGNSEILDYSVSDSKTNYTSFNSYGSWDINASFNEKAYKYGIYDAGDHKELCFGISNYGSNIYTLKYKISGFVGTTEDSDIVYWELIPRDLDVDSAYIKIYSDFRFEDTLDVWGYGNYGGYAYVYDGYIEMSNEDLSSSDYMTILVKFDKGTFNTTNVIGNDFDHYYEMAEDGAEHYSEKGSVIGAIFSILFSLIYSIFWVVIVYTIIKSAKNADLKSGSSVLDFGVKGKRLPKDVELFRELPCGKDIYRAYWVANNYNLMKKKTDFLGAILLKWIKQGKIRIESKTVGMIFKKEDTTIVFNQDIGLDTDLETDLYNYMYTASKDGILEGKEFERWCSNNYSKILKWFDKVLDYENEKLEAEGKLVKEEKTTLKIFKSYVYKVDESMYQEAIYMKGLKKFFDEFENMKDKEAIEVTLWEEYLMYAQIFGVADKVAKQFKELYPDVITDQTYNSMIFVNSVSRTGMVSATTARSRAQSYSSGGGGFSSGGGGGGSFGSGGGGGFR